ncbi:MAG: RsmB/NOP family class I SAM-dependent RNA methyltransferase [Bacteroidota bacterium]|nr:RsmB/NOP family class I SAM-dependent RNA methyltransferase [Bacteroidota bacterium]
MTQLPESFLNSLKGIEGFNKEAFEKVHASGKQVTSIRINPLKWNGEWAMDTGFPTHDSRLPSVPARAGMIHDLENIPWTDYGFYLDQRPSFTFDPLFHAGCYYVQEASGMFLEQAFKQLVDLSQPLKVLDLCAAPGGKSTHIHSLISPGSLLVSNEVIRSRNNILMNNIIKWGCNNVMVTQNDPSTFAKLENYFDVIVVDAPCSGSGLFRRNADAIEEWSLNNVQLCCQRQQRILADVLPALKKDGMLIYSTCAYSREEDEDILNWMIEEFKPAGGVESVRIKIEESWGIVESHAGGNYSYRFFPDKVKGEGFFITCFRKRGEDKSVTSKNFLKQQSLSKIEIALVKPWIKKVDLHFIKQNNTVFAVDEKQIPGIYILLSRLRVSYFGIILGELMREKLVPDHALAMSLIASDKIERIELNYDQTIQYLKRKDINIEIKSRGWVLVTYQQQSLGWINVLQNRVNNYYPKMLRILKDT